MTDHTAPRPAGLAPAPLLPGQAAAPPGPCDLTGMYVMHHAFRRDLARFVRATALTPREDRATWAALERWWGLMGSFLHEHHEKEDEALWPELRRRAVRHDDADALAVLDAMQAEHADIDPLLEAASEGWPRLRSGGTEAHRRAQVEVLTAATRVLDAHLRHEEAAAISLVQRWVSGEEWAHLERTRLADKPPPRVLLFFLPWAADGLPDDVRDHLLAAGGAPIRGLLALGRRGYAKRAQQAFGHLDGGPWSAGAGDLHPA